MPNKLAISDNLQKVLLGLLIILLFANWYNYLNVYYALQDMNGSWIKAISGILPDSIANNEKLIGEIFPKGVSYVMLMSLNIALSLSIILVYFRDKKIMKQGARMIFIYFSVGFIAMNICYFAGWHDYFMSARYALNLLASPLVECSMIPILKLANSDMNKPQQ